MNSNKSSILSDIIVNTRAQGRRSKTLFNTYRNPEEIGINIIQDFIEKYDKEKGFYLSDTQSNEIGILTQLQGLLTLITLLKFNMSSQVQNRLLPIIYDVVNDIDKHICKDDGFVFDLSPYNPTTQNSDMFITDYIDTIGKALKSFVELRGILLRIKRLNPKIVYPSIRNKSLIEYCEMIILHTMRKINESAIKLKHPIEYQINQQVIKDINGEDLKYVGWNYCHYNSGNDVLEPSLYFTFVISNAYFSFFENFADNIEYERNAKKMTQEELEQYEFADEKSFYDNQEFFNRPEVLAEYKKFNKRCLDAGHYVDYKIRLNKVDVSTDFLSLDLKPVTFQDIEKSTTNDALFNTLFAINIMLSGGTDIDYDAVGRGQYFYEYLQNVIQNIQKAQKKLEESKREHIVEQYVLTFNESFPEVLQSTVRQLRKQRITMLTLVPLVITVHAAISKYVIKYPQKQMVNYLEDILERRYQEEDKYLWIWDDEEYNIHVNLMYIEALSDFYEYYSEYEAPFLHEGNRFKQNQIEKQREELLIDKQAALEKQKNDYESKIRALEAEKELLSAKNPVIEVLENMIFELMESKFESFLTQVFNEAAKDIFHNEENPTNQALLHLIASAILPIISIEPGLMDEGNKINYGKEKHKKLEKDVITMIKNRIAMNISIK